MPASQGFNVSVLTIVKTGAARPSARRILETAPHTSCHKQVTVKRNHLARVVELADTADSKSVAFIKRAGSSPAPGTTNQAAVRW